MLMAIAVLKKTRFFAVVAHQERSPFAMEAIKRLVSKLLNRSTSLNTNFTPGVIASAKLQSAYCY
jgi:hypothetical protein